MPNDKTELIAACQRYRFVIEQRHAGQTFREIADAAREQFGEKRLPKGYDERYACNDLRRALAKVRKNVESIAAEYRVLQMNQQLRDGRR